MNLNLDSRLDPSLKINFFKFARVVSQVFGTTEIWQECDATFVSLQIVFQTLDLYPSVNSLGCLISSFFGLGPCVIPPQGK